MKERVNKPRAFISYSSKDSVFIQRIENDLRNCQIEPWRDRKEIRDGKPWLDSIFEEGLPTCDVVIAYFTPNSLNSNMVAKEVDAAQIRLLADKGISFLPYVDCSETRDGLRLDLKTLHCRVWNPENYNEVLPTVVAEVWRSYLERVVGIQPSDFPTTLPKKPAHLHDLQFVIDLKPLLTIHGLLNEVRREQSTFLLGSSQKFHVTDWAFSDKLYRFVSWLDYHNKFGLEASYEFVEFSPATTTQPDYSETEPASTD